VTKKQSPKQVGDIRARRPIIPTDLHRDFKAANVPYLSRDALAALEAHYPGLILDLGSPVWKELVNGTEGAGHQWTPDALEQFKHRIFLQLRAGDIIIGDPAQAVLESAASAPAAPPPPRVPRLGERLIGLFAPREVSEAMLGDLEEKFAVKVATDGVKKARRWYWREVGLTGLSFGWRWLQRAAALEAVLRRIGL